MNFTMVLSASILLSAVVPVAASPCGTHIATIERRLASTGGSKVTGDAPDPKAESGSSKAIGQAPNPANPAQKPNAGKIEEARGMIAKAKTQDEKGDQQGCEATMTEATRTIGALP